MKILVPNYTFDASAQTVTFDDYDAIDPERVLLITNTTDNVIIYNFSSSPKGNAGVSGNELTLTYDTTSMSDSDSLQIFYDDPDAGILVDSQTFTKKSVSAGASGDNTIHTPSAGKKIRLHFFGYSAGVNVTGVLASLKFGSSGTVFDRQYLIAAGQPYARNIQAGKRYIDGGVDEELILNLDDNQTVYVNIEIEEV